MRGERGPAPLWAKQARQWSLLGPPLRPSTEDLACAQESIDGWTREHEAAPTALILGVTPGLAARRWPAGSSVVAVDLSLPMIRDVWPAAPDRAERRSAIQADWTAMPLGDASCDLVFGDGSLAVPNAQRPQLAHSVRRVLRRNGTATLRVFVRPDVDESPDDVWEQLVDRHIGTFAGFKLRLLMSLVRDNGDVPVMDAWKYFESRCTSADALAQHLGWPLEEVQTIQAYRDQRAVYGFPTLVEFRAAIREIFDEAVCVWPAYELGDRCPTFILRS